MIPIGAIGSPPAPGVAATHKPEPVDPGVLKAAKDFESIFVRQMLKSLEKTTAAGGGAKAQAGQSTYGAMVVDSMSESIAAAGGLGLADVIARSMMATHPGLKSPEAAATSAGSPARGLAPALNPLKSF